MKATPVRKLLACSVFLLVALMPRLGLSQETRGTIRGLVTDSSGGVLAGATVRVSDATTNESTVVQSNADGIFVIPLLRAATYQVTAEKAGFKKYSRDGVQVRMQEIGRAHV